MLSGSNVRCLNLKLAPLVSLQSLQLGNNDLVSLSLNNPFKYVKGLYFLVLSANKLNTFHKNTLPDNIVHGLKTFPT
jgi:hypothetical protein